LYHAGISFMERQAVGREPPTHRPPKPPAGAASSGWESSSPPGGAERGSSPLRRAERGVGWQKKGPRCAPLPLLAVGAGRRSAVARGAAATAVLLLPEGAAGRGGRASQRSGPPGPAPPRSAAGRAQQAVSVAARGQGGQHVRCPPQICAVSAGICCARGCPGCMRAWAGLAGQLVSRLGSSPLSGAHWRLRAASKP
jgi:hypothetical protein